MLAKRSITSLPDFMEARAMMQGKKSDGAMRKQQDTSTRKLHKNKGGPRVGGVEKGWKKEREKLAREKLERENLERGV